MAGDRKIQLGIEIEQAQQQKVLSSIDAIRKNLATIGGEAAKESQAVKALGERFKELERSTALTNVVKQFADLSSSEEQAIKNAGRLRETLSQIGATKDEIREAVRAFHELTIAKVDAAKAPAVSTGRGGGGLFGKIDAVENIAGRLGAGLSGAGAGGLGGVVSGGADVLQTAVSLKQLGESLGIVGVSTEAAAAGSTTLVASLGPLAIVFGGVAIAAKVLFDEFQKGKKAVEEAVDAEVQKYNQEAQNAIAVKTMSSDQVKQRLEALAIEKKAGAAAAKFLADRLKEQEAEYAKYSEDVIRGPAIKSAIDKLKSSQDSVIANNDKLKIEYDNLTKVVQPLVDARERETKATQDLLTATDARLAEERELAQLSKMSSDALKQKLDDNHEEIKRLEEARAALLKSGDTSAEAKKKIADYTEQINKLSRQDIEITQTALDAAKARETQLAAEKVLNDEATKTRARIEAEIAQEAARDKSRNDAIVARYDQYEKEIKQVQEQNQQAQLDAAKKYQENLVNIAKKAADDSNAALARLIDQQKQLRTSYARDEAKEIRKQQLDDLQTQIKAQREEAKAFEDHQQKLIQIRKSSELEEQDLLLNRNYRGLFQLRQKTAASMEDENSSFSRGQQERQQTAQQEQQDITRQRQFERNERLIAYQQANADAQARYQQELVLAQQAKIEALNAARIAYNNDLNTLRQKLNTELQLKRAAAQQDLALINRTEQEKLAAYVNSLNAAMRFANLAAQSTAREGPNAGNPITTVSGGQVIRRYASGGIMQAGRGGQVNEPGSSGRETYTANGRTIAFPGMGVFYPSQSGVVNANNNSPISLTFNVTESKNAQATAQAIKPIVLSVLNDVSGRRGA